MDSQVCYNGNLPGNPPVGFQVKKLETQEWVSRSKVGNPPVVIFQKTENSMVHKYLIWKLLLMVIKNLWGGQR